MNLMKKYILSGLIVIMGAVFIYSCKDDNTAIILRRNELQKLDEFIAEHYPDSLPKPSGLYFISETKGVGDTIRIGDRVQIFYSVWTIDSTLIDESAGYSAGQRYNPYEFTVGAGDAIQGLEEGVSYMYPGGKAHLVIPSQLAYGQNGSYYGNSSSYVGPFTTLLMEVEVYKVFPYGN